MNARHAPKHMTKRDNAQAAFCAVNLGILDRLDAGLISRTTGVPIDQVQAMIEVRRERERSAHG